MTAPPLAYEWAGHVAGVPSFVLWAVALEESGTPLRSRLIPWPWTLNVAGAPSRYTSQTSACDALRQALRSTRATRIDVGLLQINIGYYGQRFPSQPCALLDPYTNLAVGAGILSNHHVSGEDWMVAVGRYHRPAGGQAAVEYRRRVEKLLRRTATNSDTRTREKERPQ